MRILENLLDPTPAPAAPADRLISGTARWADRHHPIRARLRAYHRRADALYWERSPDTMEHMGRQVLRLDDIREPLARAARALYRELGADYLLLADDLTDLWHSPGIGRQIGEDTVYKIDYIGYLLTEWVEDMQEAAESDPRVARVLAEHLDRP